MSCAARAIRATPAAALLLPALFAAPGLAGGMLCEDQTGGAGSLPSTALRAVGVGPLVEINGTLSAAFGFGNPGTGGDLEDMYLVQIVDPAAFAAFTTTPTMGTVVFETSLWLFDPCGKGLLGNRRSPQDPKSGFSLLLPEPTDGVGPGVTTPGVYFLAVAGSTRLPLSDGGPIYLFADETEISGPDGPGGQLEIIEWGELPSFGDYTIQLEGVAFLGLMSDVCLGDLDGNGEVDGADLGILLGGWGPCGTAICADLNGDGVVDGADLGILLGAWGPCAAQFGTPCGDPAAGDCTTANGTPGCEGPCCCTTVCQMRPECCAMAWDQACAQMAAMVCE